MGIASAYLTCQLPTIPEVGDHLIVIAVWSAPHRMQAQVRGSLA